jgi:cardiolipin synthase A/B
MKLIVQPEAGIPPIVTAIRQARKTIDIVIFRLDRYEIARELEAAVSRGVHVRALTAHQNRGGTKSLRKLEMQLLQGGVTVARTAKDLVRYHAKMMIVDARMLHVYGFNFTSLDIKKSRSFGVISKNAKLVQEAIKLFEADFERQPYVPASERLIVSPENARDRLTAFIKTARKQLLIYDPGLTDDVMVRLLIEKEKAGVGVKIIGKVDAKGSLACEEYPGKRLHVRAIIRDGRRAFIGSQSLRRVELEERREVGVLVNDARVVREMQQVFERDWSETDSGRKEARKEAKKAEKAEKAEKKDEVAAVS